MDATDTRRDQRAESGDETAQAVVCCHETRPGRHVFTERGNTNGWISCDTVVPARE